MRERLVEGAVVVGGGGSFTGVRFMWWWGWCCSVFRGWLGLICTSCEGSRVSVLCRGEGVHEVRHECVKFPREYVVEVGSGECFCMLLCVY